MAQKKKIFSKYYYLLTMHLVPRALPEIYNEINPCLLTTNILQPVDQGVILTFKSYYLKNIVRLVAHACRRLRSGG
jgi:hypothetical protein